MPHVMAGLRLGLLQRLARWSAARGWHDTSISLFHSCLGLMQELADPRGEGIMHHNLGLAHQMKGDVRGALVHFHRALKLEKLCGDEAHLAQTLLSVGDCHRKLEDPHRARTCFQQAYLYAIQARLPMLQAACCQFAAEASADAGDRQNALLNWERLTRLGREMQQLCLTLYGLNQQARLLMELNDIPAARDLALEAHSLAEASRDTYNLGLASLTLGEAAMQGGRWSQARKYLKTAEDCLKRDQALASQVQTRMRQLQAAEQPAETAAAPVQAISR